MERGGWLTRETADAFADYAALAADAFGDRVAAWATIDEPLLEMAYGYAVGIDAPGLTLLGGAFQATHHQLLAHGRAAAALRSASRGADRHRQPAHHRGSGAARRAPIGSAARFFDLYHNRQFADPILLGHYPAAILDMPGAGTDVIQDGDLAADFRSAGLLRDQLCPPDHRRGRTGQHRHSLLPGTGHRHADEPGRLAHSSGITDQAPGGDGPAVSDSATGVRHGVGRSLRRRTRRRRRGRPICTGSPTWTAISRRSRPPSRRAATSGATSTGRCSTAGSGPRVSPADSAWSGSTREALERTPRASFAHYRDLIAATRLRRSRQAPDRF